MTNEEHCKDDADLTAEQLDDKYNPDGDGEHPGYPRGDWVNSVFHHETLVGYWEWVAYQLELCRD